MSSATSSSHAGPNMSRNDRAKWARDTINKKIPLLLRGDAIARGGIASTVLHRDLPALPAPRTPAQIISPIEIWNTDTISATIQLYNDRQRSNERIAILNMASSLRPGGGVLSGASAQEEFLCVRTTLYPALRDGFYRLPELSVVYTSNVLVFRGADGVDLPKKDWFHIDVATAAMPRAPDLMERDGKTTWADPAINDLVLRKMRLLMRALCTHGATKVVLGAWGCGAYGNPVQEVAQLWRTVLVGNKRGRKEHWEGIDRIVFAITSPAQVQVFQEVFSEISV